MGAIDGSVVVVGRDRYRQHFPSARWSRGWTRVHLPARRSPPACPVPPDRELDQSVIDALDVERLRIEVWANPFDVPPVLWMARRPKGIQEVGVAVRATAVLGRSCAHATDARRHYDADSLRRELLLDLDAVLPVVAEVVLVDTG